MKNEKQIRFLSLYKPHHEAFVRFCTAKAYGTMETEDLVNETIARVYERLEKLKSEKAFLSYLFSVASNVVNNQIRKKKIVFYSDDINPNRSIAPDQHADTQLDIEILYRALNALPQNMKEALVLFEISGYSIKEIAELQKTSENAVKQRLRRGRIKLSELLCEKDLKSEPVERRSTVLCSLFF